MNNIKEIKKEIEQIIDDYGAPENITDEIKEFFSGNLDIIVDFIKESNQGTKEVTLTAKDIPEITELMNKGFPKGSRPSQGFLEFLLCKTIRDYKGIDFFKQESIKSPDKKVLTMGDLLRKALIYKKGNKSYKKIERYEKIAEGAMQSWIGGELKPIRGTTVGRSPAQFAMEKDFYNPI